MASYIAPNTDIVLCTNVPLDNSYDHTITFASKAAQLTYFASKAYKTVTANSYQRTMSDKLRIACTMDEAVRCNYLFFTNKSFENKTFYAFITGWEYVNNVTTEITYEIDVFQSFYFDIDIKPSFVEREHSNSDVIGANLVPEGLEQGDYVVRESYYLDPTSQSGVVNNGACVIFFTTFYDDAECTNYDGGYINYVYSCLNIIKKTTTQSIATFLDKVITKRGSLDGIVAAYTIPFEPVNPEMASPISWSVRIAKAVSNIDGYIPRNNKLFTAPYNIMKICSDSDVQEYDYEYFYDDNTYCNFSLTAVLLPEPVLTLTPGKYLSASNNPRMDLRMTISHFPQCALSQDVYKVYLAQNAASLPASMISTVLNNAGGIAGNILSGGLGNIGDIGGAVKSGISIVTDIGQTLAQLHDIKIRPPQVNGTQTAASDYAVGAKRFTVQKCTIRAEFAMIIDGFFDMFGYATHQVKVPNITGRPHWNYVKTKGIVLDIANAPQPYIQKMIQCFDKGITFWHNPSEVGNYYLDNRPV